MKNLKFIRDRFVSIFWGITALALVSCQFSHLKMEPTIPCPFQVEKFVELPSAFDPLSVEERQQEWGKECFLGNSFAREWDFYRAITCYKRAIFLLPKTAVERRLQIEYAIILSYYLGNKHQEALTLFEASELSQADQTFPGFKNLLLLVYDCYLATHQEDKAACVMQAIDLYSPQTSQDLCIYEAIKGGEIEVARDLVACHSDCSLMEEFCFYDQFKKSPQKARILNAILPGAGYYYVGEKKSALTSFVINTLFIAAAYQFFDRGYPAAGAITASLELGWYLGGINGAGIEAHQFNTRLFEGVGKRVLLKNQAFPLLMFETSF